MDILELLDDILEPCKHCGSTPVKREINDCTFDTLTMYQCTGCTLETTPCWPALDAKRRWNNGTPYFVLTNKNEFQNHIEFYKNIDKPHERNLCKHSN